MFDSKPSSTSELAVPVRLCQMRMRAITYAVRSFGWLDQTAERITLPRAATYTTGLGYPALWKTQYMLCLAKCSLRIGNEPIVNGVIIIQPCRDEPRRLNVLREPLPDSVSDVGTGRQWRTVHVINDRQSIPWRLFIKQNEPLEVLTLLAMDAWNAVSMKQLCSVHHPVISMPLGRPQIATTVESYIVARDDDMRKLHRILYQP